MTGTKKWELRLQSPPWSGILSTAGGLVFSGDMEGNFSRSTPKPAKLYGAFRPAELSTPTPYLHQRRQAVRSHRCREFSTGLRSSMSIRRIISVQQCA